MLAVGGLLNDRRTGSPVPVMADIVGQWVIGKENLNAGRPGPVLAMNTEEFRKTIFVQWRRSRPLTVLDTFDLPKMEPNCERRNSSDRRASVALSDEQRFHRAGGRAFCRSSSSRSRNKHRRNRCGMPGESPLCGILLTTRSTKHSSFLPPRLSSSR